MRKTPLKAKTKLKNRRHKRIDLKCHDLAREIWRLKGFCENCGKGKPEVQLQGAHIFGTGAFRRLGADLRNGFCFCALCHRRYTDAPSEFVEFIEKSWAKGYMPALKASGKLTEPVDWEDRLRFLKDIKKSILAGELTIETARTYEQP